MLSGIQRSPNEFIPFHKHLRSYQQRLTIWDLPEEILVQLLKTLHVKDLLSMRQVGFSPNQESIPISLLMFGMLIVSFIR